MKWSWKIGKFAGISVYVHATFLILIAWLVLTEWGATHNGRAVLNAVLFILALFACVVAHEFGHALAARRFGISTRDITLLPIGGVSSLERIPDDPRQELWVALAGPAVSVAIGTLILVVLWVTGAGSHFSRTGPWGNVPFFEQLLLANFVLAVFNLLPAFPLDGGRVFRALLARRMDYSKATRIAANVGQGMAFFFALLGLFGNPFLLLIALFVWIGAGQEAASVQIKSALRGIPVSEVTVTDFSTVSSSDTLARPVELMLHGTQQDFPVVDHGRLTGILTRKELLSGLSQTGPDTPVSQVMRKEYQVISSTEMLQTASEKLQGPDSRVLLVMEGERLLGLFTIENLSEFVMVQSALRDAGKKPGSIHQEQRPVKRDGSPKLIVQ
ncbi:MAG: site-2 protease family protein [Acidobacteriia bacterium]|nr:site-2 protease family protein [Terriglobia bacterium]